MSMRLPLAGFRSEVGLALAAFGAPGVDQSMRGLFIIIGNEDAANLKIRQAEQRPSLYYSRSERIGKPRSQEVAHALPVLARE